jgi:hypothetical protein
MAMELLSSGAPGSMFIRRSCGCASGSRRDGQAGRGVRDLRNDHPDLLALADWLVSHGVTQVAMEGTGVYWKCVC